MRADLDQTGQTGGTLADCFRHPFQGRNLATLDIELQKIDRSAIAPPIVEPHDIGDLPHTALGRRQTMVAGVVLRQPEPALSGAVEKPFALEPDIVATVEDAIGLEQLEIAGLRLESEHLSRSTDSLGRQHREVADMGADVDDPVAGSNETEQQAGLHRLPEAESADDAADDLIMAGGEQAKAADRRYLEPREVLSGHRVIHTWLTCQSRSSAARHRLTSFAASRSDSDARPASEQHAWRFMQDIAALFQQQVGLETPLSAEVTDVIVRLRDWGLFTMR